MHRFCTPTHRLNAVVALLDYDKLLIFCHCCTNPTASVFDAFLSMPKCCCGSNPNFPDNFLNRLSSRFSRDTSSCRCSHRQQLTPCYPCPSTTSPDQGAPLTKSDRFQVFAEKAIDALLPMLKHSLDRPVSALSGGQRKRLVRRSFLSITKRYTLFAVIFFLKASKFASIASEGTLFVVCRLLPLRVRCLHATSITFYTTRGSIFAICWIHEHATRDLWCASFFSFPLSKSCITTLVHSLLSESFKAHSKFVHISQTGVQYITSGHEDKHFVGTSRLFLGDVFKKNSEQGDF